MEGEKRYWCVLCTDQLLVEQTDEGLQIPYQSEPPTPLAAWTKVHRLTLFEEEEFCAYAIDAPITNDPRYQMVGLRASYELIPRRQYLMAGKGAEIIYWDKSNRYCPVCAMPMKFHTAISKRCTGCGKEIWPTVAVATIVLVRRGDAALMVHARNFRGNYYGLVAGFVETGETLEECVAREVFEETGLHITNIHYFGSQPWPYPFGLMVGFTADYSSGTVKIDPEELSDAQFFTKDNLPDLPGKASIARRLIDDWLAKTAE